MQDINYPKNDRNNASKLFIDFEALLIGIKYRGF